MTKLHGQIPKGNKHKWQTYILLQRSGVMFLSVLRMRYSNRLVFLTIIVRIWLSHFKLSPRCDWNSFKIHNYSIYRTVHLTSGEWHCHSYQKFHISPLVPHNKPHHIESSSILISLDKQRSSSHPVTIRQNPAVSSLTSTSFSPKPFLPWLWGILML